MDPRIRIQNPKPNPDPLVRGMDPRIWIRIHPKMSWIRNSWKEWMATDPDPNPGGPKTYISYGSGSRTGTLVFKYWFHDHVYLWRRRSRGSTPSSSPWPLSSERRFSTSGSSSHTRYRPQRTYERENPHCFAFLFLVNEKIVIFFSFFGERENTHCFLNFLGESENRPCFLIFLVNIKIVIVFSFFWWTGKSSLFFNFIYERENRLCFSFFCWTGKSSLFLIFLVNGKIVIVFPFFKVNGKIFIVFSFFWWTGKSSLCFHFFGERKCLHCFFPFLKLFSSLPSLISVLALKLVK